MATGYPSWNTHYYYQADGNGNITALEDNNQNLITGYRYDPFGNTLYAPVVVPGSLNPFRFSSKQLLSPSGLYYYGYRWYDPNLQRWLNRDLLEEFGGLNLYVIVSNDPVDNSDPFGLDETPPPPRWPPISPTTTREPPWPPPSPTAATTTE